VNSAKLSTVAEQHLEKVREHFDRRPKLTNAAKSYRRILAHYYNLIIPSFASVLEVGCGSGDVLRDFIKWGARPENIVGIELLPERLAEAVELCPKGINIHQGNAAEMPFPDKSFDVVLQSTVFTSVLDTSMKEALASEMCRVLKPDGLILWYDYHMNNPRNPDVKGVKRQEIHSLFPKCEILLQRITLAPPISRLLAPYSWLLCYLLSKLPWLCTHYIGVIRKPK